MKSSLNKSHRHRISALIWAKEPSRNPSWSSPALCRRSRLRSLDSESFRAIRGPKDHPSRLDLVHRKLSQRSSWHPDRVCGLAIAVDLCPRTVSVHRSTPYWIQKSRGLPAGMFTSTETQPPAVVVVLLLGCCYLETLTDVTVIRDRHA